MDVTLKVLKGAKSGGKIAIKKEKFLIGRSRKCNLCAGTESISRQHCVITRGESHVSIEDLGSRNGTLVNGKRIDQLVRLKSGDELTVGPLRFLVTISNGISNLKRGKVKSIADAAQRTASTHSADVQEDDITSWLSGTSSSGTSSSGTSGSSSATDTQTIRLDDTNAAEMKLALEEFAQQEDQTGLIAEQNSGVTEKDSLAQENSASEDVEPEAGKSKSGKRKGPGKLPFLPSKPTAKDSCSAAAEALRSWGRKH